MTVGSSSSSSTPIVHYINDALNPYANWEIGIMFSSLHEAIKLKYLTDEECKTISINNQKVVELGTIFASSVFIQHSLRTIHYYYENFGFQAEGDATFYHRHYQQSPPEQLALSDGVPGPKGIQSSVSCSVQSSKAHNYSPEECDQLYPTKPTSLYMERLHQILAKHGLELKNFLGSAYVHKISS